MSVREIVVGACVALLAASACVDDEFADGQFLCSPSGGADECPSGMSCGEDGRCRRTAEPADAGCKPKTCDSVAPLCGTLDDGCGSTLQCGCWPPNWCGGGGIPGQCGCQPTGTMERTAAAFWSDATIGTAPWTAPQNAGKSDNAWATADVGDGAITNYLKAADFGFDLPEGAVVQGVEISIERSTAESAPTIADHEVRLAVDGKLVAKVGKKTAAWTSTDATIVYGSETDTWEASEVTRDLVNQANFGMALSVTSSAGPGTARVDVVRMKVHFANPSCPAGG